MASDESMTIQSCISMQENEYEDDTDEGYDRDQPHPLLSRLSMCTSNEDHEGGDSDSMYNQGENGTSMFMSLLSIDSFDGDVDDDEESSFNQKLGNSLLAAGLSSEDESEREPECYSLPATPPTRRRDLQAAGAGTRGRDAGRVLNPMVAKEYASENDAKKSMSHDSKRSRRRSRRRMMRNRSSWLSPSSIQDGVPQAKKRLDDDDDDDDEEEEDQAKEEIMNMNMMNMCGSHCHSFSGESEGTGMVVITRPKGGKRNLCMDKEEVKACRDLGFELEHDSMKKQQQQQLESMPSRLSISTSTLDTNYSTSSGGNSPIANWRISSPGDNPRDVKARLKVWAQAVALASASRQCT